MMVCHLEQGYNFDLMYMNLNPFLLDKGLFLNTGPLVIYNSAHVGNIQMSLSYHSYAHLYRNHDHYEIL